MTKGAIVHTEEGSRTLKRRLLYSMSAHGVKNLTSAIASHVYQFRHFCIF